MEKITMDVIVHKANLPLMSGETLHEYTSKCGNGAKKFIKEQNGMGEKESVWLVDVYSDSVVVETTKNNDDEYKCLYYNIEYSRDKSGNFTYSNATEVKRVVRFEPVNESVGIAKSVKDGIWEPVKKSVFDGII